MLSCLKRKCLRLANLVFVSELSFERWWYLLMKFRGKINKVLAVVAQMTKWHVDVAFEPEIPM